MRRREPLDAMDSSMARPRRIRNRAGQSVERGSHDVWCRMTPRPRLVLAVVFWSPLMLETEVTVNRFLVGYCKMLVGDLDDERLAEQPLPGVNHPAWILGHLTVVAHRAMS